MNEYGFSIILAWRNNNQKLPCDSGGATKIGSSVGGVTRQVDQVYDFPSFLHL
jgi:hypothetical protein